VASFTALGKLASKGSRAIQVAPAHIPIPRGVLYNQGSFPDRRFIESNVVGKFTRFVEQKIAPLSFEPKFRVAESVPTI